MASDVLEGAYDTRHRYPPKMLPQSLMVWEPAGLTSAEKRGLYRLQVLPGGVRESRDVTTEVVNGEVMEALHNREVFDLVEASGMRYLFDVRGIADAIVDNRVPYKVGTMQVAMADYLTLMETRGVEEDHLPRIDARRLDVPGLMLMWPDGTMVLGDGVHRLVKRFRKNKPFMRVVVVPQRGWQPYLLDWSRAVVKTNDGEVKQWSAATNALTRGIM